MSGGEVISDIIDDDTDKVSTSVQHGLNHE